MRNLGIVGFLAVVMIIPFSLATAGDLVVKPAVGVKAGVNVSSVEVATEGTSSRTGFVGGAYAKFPLKQMTLQLEALYSQKGFDKNSFMDISDWQVELDYITFPFLLNVEVPMDHFDPYFYGGFSFSFLASAKEQNSGTNGEWVDIKDDMNSSVWDFILGFGFRKHRVSLDFRYCNGLSKLNQEANTDQEYYKMEDSTLSFTVAYAIWD